MEPLQLIVTIVERGRGNRVARLYTQHQVFTHMQCEGVGTATSEILDILGIGSSEKDVLISLAPRSTVQGLMDRQGDALQVSVGARGIAFSLPLEAASARLAAVIDIRTKKENGGNMVQEQKNSLILVVVNRGYTEAVMATARRAGARGGTVIKARWSGDTLLDQIPGVAESQTEKEIIAIVVSKDVRNGVMEQINTHHGTQTEAGALLCAMGVDQVARLS